MSHQPSSLQRGDLITIVLNGRPRHGKVAEVWPAYPDDFGVWVDREYRQLKISKVDDTWCRGHIPLSEAGRKLKALKPKSRLKFLD